MRDVIFEILVLVMIAGFTNGCGQSQKGENTIFANRQDTDVTASADYNFKSFAGTVWKTKVKVAIADLKSYKGEHHITFLTPRSFDPKHPEYTSPLSMEKMIAELPVGTRLRIDRLMKDNGNWGGVQVRVSLVDVTASIDSGKAMYLDKFFLAKNRFVWGAWSDSKEWAVDPDMLEKAE